MTTIGWYDIGKSHDPGIQQEPAAKRFLSKWRQDHPPRNCLVTADRRSAHAPHLETRHDHGGHSMFGVNAGDQASRCTQGQAAEEAGRLAHEERHDGAAGVVHRCRLVHAVPRNASRSEVRGNGREDWESGQAMVHHCSGVTTWRVRKRNVDQRLRGGRARWKMEHETCNTRTHQGDTLAHHYGHGEPNLSVGCATIMRRAFLVAHPPPLGGALCRAGWAPLGSQRLVWERLRALF